MSCPPPLARLQVRLPTALKDELEEIAAELGVEMSAVLSHLVAVWRVERSEWLCGNLRGLLGFRSSKPIFEGCVAEKSERSVAVRSEAPPKMGFERGEFLMLRDTLIDFCIFEILRVGESTERCDSRRLKTG